MNYLIIDTETSYNVGFLVVGYGGIASFLIPELTRLYCGYPPMLGWQKNTEAKVKDDREVYALILHNFITSTESGQKYAASIPVIYGERCAPFEGTGVSKEDNSKFIQWLGDFYRAHNLVNE